jgi:hypothetical protein
MTLHSSKNQLHGSPRHPSFYLPREWDQYGACTMRVLVRECGLIVGIGTEAYKEDAEVGMRSADRAPVSDAC